MSKRVLRSLRSSDSFKRFVLDQLSGIDVTSRSMFGGCGLYSGEYFFGIIASDVLYLKVDDTTRGEYEDAGMKAFKPYEGRSGTMAYYAVPISVLECAPDLLRWVRTSIEVARRAKS